jgi:hypothetical protein
MRPDRTVYVLGAGFSADAGVPTVKSFLKRSREHFDSPATPLPTYLEPHYRTVLRFRQDVKRSRDSLRLDLDDVEVLFSLIDMESLAAPHSGKARSTADSIKHMIAHTVTISRRSTAKFEVRIKNDDLGTTRLTEDHLKRLHHRDRTQPEATVLRLGQYDLFAAVLAGLFEPVHHQVEDCVVTFNYDTVLDRGNLGVWRRCQLRSLTHRQQGDER